MVAKVGRCLRRESLAPYADRRGAQPEFRAVGQAAGIMLSQLLLLLMGEWLSLGELVSRAFIRRFIVEPLITHGASANAEIQAELEGLRAQNLALKDVVATQLLELRAREMGKGASDA